MATAAHYNEGSNDNPLDIAEQVVASRNWIFDRPIDDELVAEISGNWSNYRMWFSWQPDLSGLMFTCAYDIRVPKHALTEVYRMLALTNERLWMGHFDINSEDASVSYRHGILLKGTDAMVLQQMEELVDIALQECERFYPAFQSVIWGGQTPENAVEFASFETFGEA